MFHISFSLLGLAYIHVTTVTFRLSCHVKHFWNSMFRSILTTVEGLNPVKLVEAPSNLLLTVPIRYFCCASSMLLVRVSAFLRPSSYPLGFLFCSVI